MRVTLLLLLAAVLLPLAAQGVQVVDPALGDPLVDGPGPYKRLLPRTLDRTRPLVIGHRGDSGEFPEHSELAYRAAVNHGAQFIECCDIVLTADLVPVCRHEPIITGADSTTNAADLFPDRVRNYTIDGLNVTGVLTVDLNLAELKTVRMRERIPTRSQAFNDFLPVMTFEECATLAKDFYTKEGIVVGIYPETKHPTWHDALVAERWPQIWRRYKDTFASRAAAWAAIQGSGPGIAAASNSRTPDVLLEGQSNRRNRRRGPEKEDREDKEDREEREKGLPRAPTMTDIVLEVAHRLGYNNELYTPNWNTQPIFLQSFEVNNLKYASTRTKMPIVQLASGLGSRLWDGSFPTYGDLLANMSGIATYAKGLGPSKTTLLAKNPLRSSGLAERAQAAGLQVHLYTLRNENSTRTDFATIADEYTFYFKTLGVEGGFTDFPGTTWPWVRANGPWTPNKWVQA